MQIDLNIADVILPDLSGPELVAQLRAENAALRVIYVSGWYDHASFPDLGDAHLLTKPFSLDDLRRAVAAALVDR